mgnify:CR=1 FL=1
MIQIDTIKYYPPHIQNIEEFKRIAEVYDKKLQFVWDRLDQMRTNKRFDQMDEAECEHWEKMLGIKLTGEETLDDRRRNVKGIWTSGLPYTAKKFTEVLDAMVGKEFYLIDINKKTKTLKVDLMLDAIMKSDYIYNLMRAMAPADMIVIVSIVFNRNRAFKKFTNADLKAYTNHELRTSTIFKQEYNTNKHLGEYTNQDLASYMEVALMTQRLGG